jgi:YD repeat-containing protein
VQSIRAPLRLSRGEKGEKDMGRKGHALQTKLLPNGQSAHTCLTPVQQMSYDRRTRSRCMSFLPYDPVGNRTVLTNSGALTTNTYNAGNELVTSQASAGVTTSTYDGDGNLLASLAPGSQSTTNTWDGENRLTRTALPSGIVDSFTYNGDGLRVQKIDSTGTTNHIWDGQNILLETGLSNIVQVVYTLEPSQYGKLISQSRAGTRSFAKMVRASRIAAMQIGRQLSPFTARATVHHTRRGDRAGRGN